MLRRTFLGIAAAIVAAPVTIAKALAELPKPALFVGQGWKVKKTFNTGILGAKKFEGQDLEGRIKGLLDIYEATRGKSPCSIILGPETWKRLAREVGPEDSFGFLHIQWHHKGISLPVYQDFYVQEGKILLTPRDWPTERSLNGNMRDFWNKHPQGFPDPKDFEEVRYIGKQTPEGEVFTRA